MNNEDKKFENLQHKKNLMRKEEKMTQFTFYSSI